MSSKCVCVLSVYYQKLKIPIFSYSVVISTTEGWDYTNILT